MKAYANSYTNSIDTFRHFDPFLVTNEIKRSEIEFFCPRWL